ncbi:single-stranded DNA-binding protein [uncultured Ruminococcus sp.]|uniref:single-stranded DNA-binding protein n=1 Tax=uncultured Ruminococcus sp. TaxID=165186 RepID=UPI0025E497BF|nr:single-stranded DNA-binding protein [uncultured Ruminococcus sp.]
MLNKIMMSGRLLTELAVTIKDDLKYCIFSIAVEQTKRKGVDAVKTDTFTCIAFDDNASAVSFLYSKGGTITIVGSLRNAPDNTAVLIVEELHFKNKFDVKVDVNSDQIF